jgi:hypothetical protein
MTKLMTVMGQKLTKREAIVSCNNIKELGIKVGDVIDDGTNHPLTLGSNLPENCARMFLGNLEKQFSKKSWKFSII